MTAASRGIRPGFHSALGLLGPPTKRAVRAWVRDTEVGLCRGIRRVGHIDEWHLDGEVGFT